MRAFKAITGLAQAIASCAFVTPAFWAISPAWIQP